MPVVTLAGLSKLYPGGAGLHATDLRIAAGECFALLGPSGAGKTTLLRLVAGLDAPDSGTVRFDGRDVTREPPHRRGVAYVPQRSALYPHLDVRDNLAVALKLAGTPRVERRRAAETAAAQLRIAHLLDRRPHQLSGGEQRRVALGRALASGRPLWLLDEPFAHLDAELRREFLAEFPLLRDPLHPTIVMVSHDPIDALALADRVGVLDEGRLLDAGSPAEVLARPGRRAVGLRFGPAEFVLTEPRPT